MSHNDNRTVVLIPHYLSVDVYAELALEIAQCSKYDTRLLVLSEKDSDTAQNKGMSQDNVISFEKGFHQKRFDKFGLNELAEQFPNVGWGTVIAAERTFTDYSFTFGGVGCRLEKNGYVVPFLLSLIKFFDSEFERIKPRAVVTVFGDNIYTHTASLVAEQRGIPFLLPHTAYINEKNKPVCGFLANTRFLESFAMIRNYLEYKSRNLTDKERERAEKLIKVLQNYEGHKTLEYIYKKKDFERPITPNLKKIFTYVKEHQGLDSRIHFYKIDILKKLKANLLRFIRSKRVNSFLAKQPTMLPEKFIFFPMHFQPEASTLINGIWYANQISLIENLSKALPLGYTLVVKEHPRGRGVRPLWQYLHIASFFNVQLSDLPSKAILKSAEMVITISGSIALEALAMKKPAIVLGRTFHTFNDIYFRVESMEQLTHLLHSILLDKAFDKIPNLQDEIYKSLLAYGDALYEFLPFGEDRKSLTKVILEELEKPSVELSNWISSRYSSPKKYSPSQE